MNPPNTHPMSTLVAKRAMPFGAPPTVVLHLCSGVTVIGRLDYSSTETPGAGFPLLEPYEIMTIPNPDSQKPQVTLIRFGSMYEIMPFLAHAFIQFREEQVFGWPITVRDEGLLAAYQNAREQNGSMQEHNV